MTPSPLFAEARRCISRSVIEALVPGGEWRGDGDYWVRSPLRADSSIGSFHITSEGLYKDFATDEGGDLIDLVCAMRGCSKVDAAEEIIRLGGGSVPEHHAPAKAKKPKPEAIIPIPEDGCDAITALACSDWARKVYGEPTKGWRYHTEAGGLAFVVMRYEHCPDGSAKQHTQFYWSAEGAKNGIPPQYRHGRPIYRLHELVKTDLPILIVEGEKCADVEVPGWFSTTWCGGSSSTAQTDWACLSGRRIVIWPDADRKYDKQGRPLADSLQPGIKAAIAIQNRLPNAEILDTRKHAEHMDGWDIADAAAEGMDLAAFTRDCPRLKLTEEAQKKLPFSFLGFDSGRYWFLPRRRRVPFTIDMGRFSPSQLLELAPLGWWGDMSLIRDNGAIKTDAAQDWIVDEQEKAGMVDLRRLRGAGVWRDGEQVLVNDGEQIVTMAGERLEYDGFTSAAGAEYIPSETRFGDMTGEESTDAEGAALAALYSSQKFARALDPIAALGWALIAPFGGLLKWRPHLWITGRRGTGKSTVLIEKLIDPLLGEFAYKGTGRATEAGLRRAANLTARPIRLDEFDPGPHQAKGDIDRLGKVVVLARNSFCDSTAVSTMATGETGTVTFIIRSCFLFASVNLLQMDAAIESRVVRVEKEPVEDIQTEMERMKGECARVMADPARYRRRIFRALPRILSDIDAVHEQLLSYLGDAREADVIAPLLCSAWAVQSSESIMGEAGTAWCVELLEDMSTMHAERIEDEERVVEHILEAAVRTDDMKTRTIAELLGKVESYEGGADDARDLLARHGLAVTNIKNGDGKRHLYLAIAQHSTALERILAGTPYERGYEQQIRRHPLCRDGETAVVRIAGKSTRCRCLDWEGFRKTYLAEDQGRLPGVEG